VLDLSGTEDEGDAVKGTQRSTPCRPARGLATELSDREAEYRQLSLPFFS